jgi:hypothetical protein
MTPEQRHHLQQRFRQLSQEEQQEFLRMLHSSMDGGLSQFNFDEAKGFQICVNGGKAFIGDINIYVNSSDLEEILQPSFAGEYAEDVSTNFWDEEEEYEPQYVVEDYRNNYSEGYSGSSFGGSVAPVVIGIVAVLGTGAFFSGIGSKTAVVTTPPPLNAANVKDDAGNVKESIPNGTKISLTGKRDGDYCKTNRGWIYCAYLAEIIPEKPAQESVKSSQKTDSSVKTAIVKPAAGQNAANLRSQPNAGKVIGNIPRGQQVQVIQCIADGCEVRSGSIQGWIYKPYLH